MARWRYPVTQQPLWSREENVQLNLKKRFSWDPDLEQRFRAVMKEYIGKGYARKLSPEEADHLGAKTSLENDDIILVLMRFFEDEDLWRRSDRAMESTLLSLKKRFVSHSTEWTTENWKMGSCRGIASGFSPHPPPLPLGHRICQGYGKDWPYCKEKLEGYSWQGTNEWRSSLTQCLLKPSELQIWGPWHQTLRVLERVIR